MGAKASLPYDGPPANLGWDIPPGALGLSLGAGRGNTNTHRSCSALLWGNKRDLWVSFLKSLQPLLLLEVIGALVAMATWAGRLQGLPCQLR